MSITVPKWRFIEAMIADAPDTRGVYVLWSNGAPLAVGHARGGADTIRSRLVAHHMHAGAGELGDVTHYSWEICRDPLAREAELVDKLGLGRRAPASAPDAPRPKEESEWSARESS
jgi:hypothetical protein